MKMVLTFKSGAQIRIDVTEYTACPNIMGGIDSLRWTTPDTWKTKLSCVDLNEVAAIHAENDDTEPARETHDTSTDGSNGTSVHGGTAPGSSRESTAYGSTI